MKNCFLNHCVTWSVTGHLIKFIDLIGCLDPKRRLVGWNSLRNGNNPRVWPCIGETVAGYASVPASLNPRHSHKSFVQVESVASVITLWPWIPKNCGLALKNGGITESAVWRSRQHKEVDNGHETESYVWTRCLHWCVRLGSVRLMCADTSRVPQWPLEQRINQCWPSRQAPHADTIVFH